MITIQKTDAQHRLVTGISRLADLRVLQNIRWTFTGNALYATAQWAMIVILARSTSARTVGTFALALAITAPVMILFNMQLRAVIATDITGRYGLWHYFKTRLLTVVGALVIISLLLLAIPQDGTTNSVILLIGLSKGVEALSDIIHGYWQLVERMDLVGRSLTIRAFLTLAGFTLSVSLTQSLVWASLSLLLGGIGVLVAYDIPRAVRAPWNSARNRARLAGFFDLDRSQSATSVTLIRLATPLGIAAALVSLNTAIPRYFIQLYCGKHELGIFAALSYFVVVGNLIINAVGQSVLPRLARLYRESRRQFNHMLVTLLVCGGIVAAASLAVVVVFGRRLLAVYGAEYAGAYPVFFTIMGAASIGYALSILNFSLNAIGAYKIQVPMFLTVTLVLAVLCRIYVPAYGIAGGALALLLCNCVQAALSIAILYFFTRSQQRKVPCPVQ